MGCWNKTCGLSNLHIYAGEPVYVFILEQNTIGGNHCYSSHLYTPVLIPFNSYYNDYGKGENSYGIGLKIIIDALKSILIEKEVGENECHDIAVKRKDFDVDLLFESIRENRLEIPNAYYNIPYCPTKNSSLEFVMMRKDVVDKILDSYPLGCWGNGSFDSVHFSDVVEEIDEFISVAHETVKKGFGLGSCTAFSMKLETSSLKTSKLLPFWDSLEMRSFVDIFQNFITLIENNQLEEAKEFVIDAMKGVFISTFMENTRRSWIPQCGEGSQNTDLDGHKLLAQTVLDFIHDEEKMLEDSW